MAYEERLPMAVKKTPEPKKTLLESTPIDEVLLEKMRQIYADYTGLQIAAVIAQIRKEIDSEREQARILVDLERLEARREILANLQIGK
jgi:hypothetical protein